MELVFSWDFPRSVHEGSAGCRAAGSRRLVDCRVFLLSMVPAAAHQRPTAKNSRLRNASSVPNRIHPRWRRTACQYCHAHCHIARGRILDSGAASSYFRQGAFSSIVREKPSAHTNLTKRGLVEEADKGLIAWWRELAIAKGGSTMALSRLLDKASPNSLRFARSYEALRTQRCAFVCAGITEHQFPLSSMQALPHRPVHRVKVYRVLRHKPPMPSPPCIS